MKRIIKNVTCGLMAFLVTFCMTSGILPEGVAHAAETVPGGGVFYWDDGTWAQDNGSATKLLYMDAGSTYESLEVTATNTLTLNTVTDNGNEGLSLYGTGYNYVFEGTNAVSVLVIDAAVTITMAKGATLSCGALGITNDPGHGMVGALTKGENTVTSKDLPAVGGSVQDIVFSNSTSGGQGGNEGNNGNPVINRYTITFEANGGSGTMDPKTVDEGSSFKLPENGFTAPSGNIFTGWDVNGVVMAVGDSITVTANVTIKALWKEVAADGSSKGVPAPQGTELVNENGEKSGYEVINSDASDPQVAYEGSEKDKKSRTVKIEGTVKDGSGNSYRVTEIRKNAIKGNKNLTKLVVGDNVEIIGDGAASSCPNLKIVILGKSVKIIGKKALYGARKAKTVKIKSTKLTKVKSGAFGKFNKGVTVDVPNKQANKYKKMLSKGGLPSGAKVK